MANPKRLGVVAAIVLFLVTIGAAVFVIKSNLGSGTSDETPSDSPDQSAGAVAPPGANQILVGILLSEFSASGPHRQTNPYGYVSQVRAMKSLHDPSIYLIPVIEPGTETRVALAKVLAQEFHGQTPLDASKVEDLKKLDVLVATAAANVPDNVLSAISESVRQGMGLLQRQLGYLTPGYTPQVDRLCGFGAGTFGWNPNSIDCEVVGNHPLLGDLSGQIGKTISMIPNGTVGKLSGIPLIRVKDMRQINLVAADHAATTGEYLYPLYISQLGKGKIVGVGFTQTKDVPEILESAHHGRFYIHCVQWLAGKELK